MIISTKKRLSVAATFISVGLLAGCATPGATLPTGAPPAPTAPVVAPTPTPTETPTPQPTTTPNQAATPHPTPPPTGLHAGWDTITVDGWAQFVAPEGWISGRDSTHVAESTTRYLIDQEGDLRVRIFLESEGGDVNPGECQPTAPWFEVLDTTPLPEADLTKEVAQSTHVQQISIYGADGEKTWYELNSTIHEVDRMSPDCVPEFVVYHEATGGYYGVASNADPQGELHFPTKEEARDYASSDDYLTTQKVIQSFRYIG